MRPVNGGGAGLYYVLLPLIPFLLSPIPGRSSFAGPEDGPGLGNVRYGASEVFQPIATIRTPHGHGFVAMHKGYLVMPFAEDGGTAGGFSFYDVSDPRSPVLVAQKYDTDTADLREPHGFSSYAGDYVVLQAGSGIQFWDWTDVRNPRKRSALDLPDWTRRPSRGSGRQTPTCMTGRPRPCWTS